jgi:branched-chain amino acid transport system substrate-binding protein
MRTRRRFSLGFVLSTFLLSWILGAPPALASSHPIKIGVIYPFTGPLAGLSELYRPGTEIAFEQAGYQVAGRKIQLIFEDTEAKPDVGLTKTRKLVERDKVDLLIGPVSSAVALAIRDYVANSGVPMIIMQATVEELTGKRGAPNIFRTAPTDPQDHVGMGRYVYAELGYKRVIPVALDYVAGQNHLKAFEKDYTAAGGQIVERVFLPFGGTDPAPFITRILSRAKDADAVHAILWGSDAVRFAKQMAEYGLRDRLPMIAFGTFTDDAIMLPAVGSVLKGIVSYDDYSLGWDHPENRWFAEAVLAKIRRQSNRYSAMGFVAGKAAVEGLRAIGGKIENREAFLGALKQLRFESPKGPIKFDEHNQAILSLFVNRVEEVGGRVQNKFIKAVHDVRAPR